MKSFFFKLAVFLLVVGSPYYYLQKEVMMRADNFYWKSTQRADHLVLGCSRACHGVHPSVLKQELGLSDPMVNFAFNVNASPYGKPYYQAVRRKLTKHPSGKGIYILSVSPPSIMDYSSSGGEREKTFRFYKLWNMNANPNVEYIFRQPRPKQALLVQLLYKKIFSSEQKSYVFKDGARYNAEKKVPKNNWRKQPPPVEFVHSTYRENYLRRTIELLAPRGNVFLVRMPVSEQKLAQERQIYPDFDQVMENLASAYANVSYYTYNDTPQPQYQYHDDIHHLNGESAQLFSRDLARRIASELKINEF